MTSTDINSQHGSDKGTEMKAHEKVQDWDEQQRENIRYAAEAIIEATQHWQEAMVGVRNVIETIGTSEALYAAQTKASDAEKRLKSAVECACVY